jgi:hypothetical protein
LFYAGLADQIEVVEAERKLAGLAAGIYLE